MDQHRDELLNCTDCGASFVFSADEASIFVERGLTPPKRCKQCRRARKERSANGEQGGGHRPGVHGEHAGNTAPGRGAAGRWSGPGAGAGPRRYTGDVNEYRSPMQDGFSASPYGLAARAPVGGAPYNPRAGAPRRGGGEYRSPMPDGFNRQGPAPRDGAPPFRKPRPDRGSGHAGHVNHAGSRGSQQAGQHGGRPRPASGAPQAAPGADASSPRARRRPQAEMFAVTCDACGAQAEVPFKPAEGREVYCPTCYKARRLAPAT